MKFTNVRESEAGVTFDVETTKSECAYLVNYAVEHLLSEGIISLNENEHSQEVAVAGVVH